MTGDCPAAPVRVVHLIPDLDTGGAEIMLARLVAAVDRSRIHSVVVSMTDVGQIGKQITGAGISVVALGMSRGRINVTAFGRLVRLLRRFKPDVLQTWLYHADVTGLIAAKCAGIRHVAWNIRCTEIDARDTSVLLRLVIRTAVWISRWPSIIVSNSEAGRAVHQRLGYATDRWTIIPNGLDTCQFKPSISARTGFRQELGLRDDVPLVGMLARFHPMKDHETFLRAADLVARRRKDVRFVLAGRGVGSNEALIRVIDQLGLQGKVYLFDERQDVPHLLAALDVAVMSSTSEGFPTVVAEAMACGTPCVATDVGDARAIIADTGIVVPPRQPAAIANGIAQLIELDEASIESLRRSVRAAIVNRFAIARIANQYTELWSNLAGVSSRWSRCVE